MTRTGTGNFRKRRSSSSNSLWLPGPLATSRPSIFAFGDEPRRRAQHVGSCAEHRERRVTAREQVAHALLGAVDAELGDEGGLAERRVRAGRLAECGRVALDIEQVVGDLEGLAERFAEIVQRLIFLLRRLAEQRAGDAAKAQERAGLHLLQARDIDRL